MLRFVAMVGGTLALGLGCLYSIHFATTSHRVFSDFEQLSRGTYYHVVAEPLRARAGTDMRATDIPGRLSRAGLRRGQHTPGPGEFRGTGGDIEYRRSDTGGDLVRLSLSGDIVTAVVAGDETVDGVSLPPEHLTSFWKSMHERRAPVPYADLPPQLVTAVLAAEDRRFFEHPGVDWRGIVRALARNATH